MRKLQPRGVCRCIEALASVVLFLCRYFLKLTAGNVLVGYHQPIRRNERARTAVIQPDRGESQVLEPRVGRLEVVSGLPLLSRGVVEGPHSIIGIVGQREG